MTFKPRKVGFRGLQSKIFTSETPLKIEFSTRFDLSRNFFFRIFSNSAYSKTRQTLTRDSGQTERVCINLIFSHERSILVETYITLAKNLNGGKNFYDFSKRGPKNPKFARPEKFYFIRKFFF